MESCVFSRITKMLDLFPYHFWEIVGKIAVGYLLIKLLISICRGVYGSFIASALGLNADLSKYGQWAVVTGSTDGIGRAFAMELAKKGLNIVLISRSLSKLQNVSAEIEEKYKRETRIIDVDFTSTSIYDRIKKELGNLEIGVLVNNVGMSLAFPEYYEALDDKFMHDTISCNVLSVTMMTKVVLPGMKERKKGMIINVSSLSSLIPAPLLSVYGASKAFVTNLSESLAVELQDTGVQVQCICPGYVVTNMSKIRRPALSIPTAGQYVQATLATTGVETLTAGYHMHKLQVFAIEFAKRYLPIGILNNTVFSTIKAVRTKYFKKMAAKKE